MKTPQKGRGKETKTRTRIETERETCTQGGRQRGREEREE